MNAYPRVYIRLNKADGIYRVQSCMVWLDTNLAWFLGSEQFYESTEAAFVDMQQRAMNFLWERGRTETEREVNWKLESE